MLTFDGVTIKQGDWQFAADLSVKPGALTAVIGPSGAGKSTLLGVVAGFVVPAAGRVIWDGQVLDALPPGKRPVSMIFQDNNLFAHLNVAQNVGLGLRPNLRLSSTDQTAVDTALAAVGLGGFATRKPGALSGGQQSRVALARALVADRPLVLLDEPFAALGPALKAEMLGLVRRILIGAGKTVVMVTHDPADAKAVADEVVLVADGMAMPPVATAEIFANPPAALATYLGR